MEITALLGSERAANGKAKELYSEVWGIANESLKEAGVATPLIGKIRKPSEHTKLIERWLSHKDVLKDEGIGKDVRETEEKLNSVFCRKNSLPERIQSKDDVIALCKWMEKDLGVRVDTTFVHEGEYWGRNGIRSITYVNGTSTLGSVTNILHEIDHLGDPFSEFVKPRGKSLFSNSYPNKVMSNSCQMFSEGSAIFAEMKG